MLQFNTISAYKNNKNKNVRIQKNKREEIQRTAKQSGKKCRIGHKARKLKYQKVALEEKYDLEMQQIVLMDLAWAWLGPERS